MGVYINKLPSGERLGAYGKAKAIARIAAEELMEPPRQLSEVPVGCVLVTVVVNHPWEAALICDTQRNIDTVGHPDIRETRYFYVARELVRAMADGPLESDYEETNPNT
jgi:hypothetical protein